MLKKRDLMQKNSIFQYFLALAQDSYQWRAPGNTIMNL